MFLGASRLSSPFSSQTSSRSIADEMAATKPDVFIAEQTAKLIELITNDTSTARTSSTLDTVKRQLAAMETQFKTLNANPEKKVAAEAAAEALRKSHTDLADVIIAKLKEQDPVTNARSRSSSVASAASDDSDGSTASTTRQSQNLADNMTQNLNFFTQSTLGRFIVAKVLQESESESAELKLPASLYMTDMVGAQPGDFFAASAALYPNGLFVATIKSPGRDLDQAAKIALVEKFEEPTNTSGKLPIDQAGTWLPFVKTSTDALLGGTRPDTFPPQLQAEMKKDLSNQIKAKAADRSWITELMSEKTGSPPWQTQFEGFEKELCDGLCLALEQTHANPDKDLLQLTMSVAEQVAKLIDDPKTYTNVIAKLGDSNLGLLIGPDAYPELEAMGAANTKWGSAIGERLKVMAHEVQKSNLHAVLNVEVKLNDAAGWVPHYQRQHVGSTIANVNPMKDFKISPRMMLPHLREPESNCTKEQKLFCENVKSFCRNPTGKDAPNINKLHHTALELEETEQPPEVKVRIALIKGIVANIKASEQNTTVADLGSRTLPKKGSIPFKDYNPLPKPEKLQFKLPSWNESSYSRALKAFQAEKGSPSATPKTLRDWVQFLKHDGAEKSAKYTKQQTDEKVPAIKTRYTDLINDSDTFKTTMEKIAEALDKKDIPEARKLLQEGLQGVVSKVTRLTDANSIKKQREVLPEMAQVYRRLDKAIVAMLAEDKPAEVSDPAANATATKPTVTPLKTLTKITDPEITKELIPTLSAYQKGRSATTEKEVRDQIVILNAELNKISWRVGNEFSKLRKTLAGDNTELQELLTLITKEIPAAEVLRAAAVNALGKKPDTSSRTSGSGLYKAKAEAEAELADATALANEAQPSNGGESRFSSITQYWQNLRSPFNSGQATYAQVGDGVQAPMTDLERKISSIQTQIDIQQEALANFVKLTEKKTELATKYPEAAKVMEKETKIQDAITERIDKLTAYAKAQRNALERDTVLGRPSGKAGETLGDALADFIENNSESKQENKQLQSDLQEGRLGNAQLRIAQLTSTRFKGLKEAIELQIPKHSLTATPVGKKDITQTSSKAWIPRVSGSSQQIALKATGGNPQDLAAHLTFAEKYIEARDKKANKKNQSQDIKNIVGDYKTALEGKEKKPSLRTLLGNKSAESHKAAIARLDDAIHNIKLRIPEETTDPKTLRIKNELIASLTDLKTAITTAEEITAPRSNKARLVAHLRDALAAMSDAPVPVAAIKAPAKSQLDFFSTSASASRERTLAVSPSASDMVAQAQKKLEKRGLYYNPNAKWDTYKGKTEKQQLLLAKIEGNQELKKALSEIVAFKDAIIALPQSDSAEFQMLRDIANLAKNDATAIATFQEIFETLKQLSSSKAKPNDSQRTNLLAHATAIATCLDATPSITVPKDPTQQALFLELGLCIDPAEPAFTAESDASFGRLYRHRPLTASLIADLAAASAFADDPSVIECMGDAFGQALLLNATDKTTKTDIATLCQASQTWADKLIRHPWNKTPVSKERLLQSIFAYEQASALYARLRLEASADTKIMDMLHDTLEDLFADIKAGNTKLVIATPISGHTFSLSTEEAVQKQLRMVSAIRIPQSHETVPAATLSRSERSRPAPAEPVISAFTTAIKTLQDPKTTTITRVPGSGSDLYTTFTIAPTSDGAPTVDGAPTTYRVMTYNSNADANSPRNALQALWGKPTVTSFTEEEETMTLFFSDISHEAITAQLGEVKRAKLPDHAQEFLRAALRTIANETGGQIPVSIAANNATLKAILNIADATDIDTETLDWLNDTAAAPTNLTATARTFIDVITTDSDRPMQPDELLLIAAMQNKPLVLLIPQDDGSYIYQRSVPDSEEVPTMIEYRNGDYQRWDPGERQVLTQKSASGSSRVPTPVNAMALAMRSVHIPARNAFGATFGETGWDTTITCWLEAAIYSAAYDPSASLINKMTEALKKKAHAADISAEKREFLTRYLEFLNAAKAGGHVSGIAALNQEVQALYFREAAIRQQDPMDFLRPLHADLDKLLGGEDGRYTRKEILKVQPTEKWIDGTPDDETYNLYDRKVKLIGQEKEIAGAREDVAKRVPIAIMLGNLATDDLAQHLTSESGSDSLRETGDGSERTEAIIGKTISYEADSLDQLPSECHITVSRSYDRTTGRLGKAPLLSPSLDSSDNRPYINLPATIADTPNTPVRYNISQIIAHSGYTNAGHYVCYFQPNPADNPTDWYKKSSNGNAATKLPGGYRDVQSELGAGDLTYTYMGVKA
jgi:hypothetical protein